MNDHVLALLDGTCIDHVFSSYSFGIRVVTVMATEFFRHLASSSSTVDYLYL